MPSYTRVVEVQCYINLLDLAYALYEIDCILRGVKYDDKQLFIASKGAIKKHWLDEADNLVKKKWGLSNGHGAHKAIDKVA